MKRWSRRLALLSILAGVGITALSLNRVSAYPKANLIVIAFDGLQARHLSSYGYTVRDVTPNLDNFISKSYLFRNNISPSPWTVPSFMSIFTSLYPSEHKVVNKYTIFDPANGQKVQTNLKQLSPNVKTIAELLKSAGYVTGGFTGDAGVKGAFGFSQGFDTYYDATIFGGLDLSIPRALDWLGQNKDKQFFLFLHGYDVHGQHAPQAGFSNRYVDRSYGGKYTGSPAEQGALREKGLSGQDLGLTDQDVKFWRAIYDEKINDADTEFGSFIGKIKDLGLWDNSIIMVISDHGTEFYEHQKFDHGQSLYGELEETLWAVHLPGQKRGKSVTSLTSTLDLMPTALNLLNLPKLIPANVKGLDLRPTFGGRNMSRDVYFETDYRLYVHLRGVQTTDGWKLVMNLNTGGIELYNLKADPGELKNLTSQEPKKAYELEQKLQQHQNKMGDKGPWLLGCSPAYADQCLK